MPEEEPLEGGGYEAEGSGDWSQGVSMTGRELHRIVCQALEIDADSHGSQREVCRRLGIGSAHYRRVVSDTRGPPTIAQIIPIAMRAGLRIVLDSPAPGQPVETPPPPPKPWPEGKEPDVHAPAPDPQVRLLIVSEGEGEVLPEIGGLRANLKVMEALLDGLEGRLG